MKETVGKKKESKHERILRQAREAANANEQVSEVAKASKPTESEQAPDRSTKVRQREPERTHDNKRDTRGDRKRKDLNGERDPSDQTRIRQIKQKTDDQENGFDATVGDEADANDFEGLLALSKPTLPLEQPVTGAKKEALLREVIPAWMKTPIDIQECSETLQAQVGNDRSSDIPPRY
jgi:hypothetical protein